jgi:N-acetylmuramate 1-kinase
MRASAKPSRTTERSDLKTQFLEAVGLANADAFTLPMDASRRSYTRLTQGNRSFMLMDAPSPEDPRLFVKMSAYLLSLGLSAPRVLGQNLENGFLLLEDFGDDTFTNLINRGEELELLYDLAVDTLINLHRTAKPTDLPTFTVEMLTRDACALIDSYCPVMSINLSESDKRDYADCWRRAMTTALMGPTSLVLRDYHVDNLMRLPNREGVAACGLLDFQDAVWGPVVFDLVSLVEDARLDLPSSLIDRCWNRYLAAFPHYEQTDLKRDGCILSAGRHAKIIGFFTRFVYQDGKPKYLQHIPRVWRLLDQCLTHPSLAEVKSWLDHHIPNRESPSL